MSHAIFQFLFRDTPYTFSMLWTVGFLAFLFGQEHQKWLIRRALKKFEAAQPKPLGKVKSTRMDDSGLTVQLELNDYGMEELRKKGYL